MIRPEKGRRSRFRLGRLHQRFKREQTQESIGNDDDLIIGFQEFFRRTNKLGIKARGHALRKSLRGDQIAKHSDFVGEILGGIEQPGELNSLFANHKNIDRIHPDRIFQNHFVVMERK